MEDAGCAGAGPALGMPDVLLMDEPTKPSRHRIHHLARTVPQVISWRAADDFARPRVHESPGLKDCRD